MNPDLWEKLDELFHSALERQPADRERFIAEVCQGDDGLREQLQSMLVHHELADTFMEVGPINLTENLTADDPDSLVGTSFGFYKILGALGAGGMGVVYSAFDSNLQRKIAMKLLSPDFTGDKNQVKRFKQEALAASALNHPNILTILTMGELDGRHFIATEFVEGETLRDIVKRGPMEPREAVDLAIQIASALAAAHTAGIVHRDIKPENIMVRPDGVAKLLDFGIAKLTEKAAGNWTAVSILKTEPGIVVGTVPYMSPEQICALDVDARTDIWSFGVMLYEMIAGRRPFDGGSSGNVVANVLESEPLALLPDIKVPAELEQIVGKALVKKREQRYQTIDALRHDLRQLNWNVIKEEQIESAKDAATHRRALRLVTAGIFLLLLVVAGVFLWSRVAGTAPSSNVPQTGASQRERQLTYSLTVQKMRRGTAYDAPFESTGQERFENGWKFRLNISSPQAGYLYLVGDASTPNATRQLTILYPDTSKGSAPILISGEQATQTEWYVFDKNPGTEKLWIVWSASAIAELESSRRLLNSRDQGLISNPTDSQRVAKLLDETPKAKPVVELSADKRQAVAKVPGDLLVNKIELEHY